MKPTVDEIKYNPCEKLKVIRRPGSDSRVVVFRRPDESVLMEINFASNHVTIEEAIARRSILDEAIKQAQEWENEK
jgi:hypothetical protein